MVFYQGEAFLTWVSLNLRADSKVGKDFSS
jgi:hypothetical protein